MCPAVFKRTPPIAAIIVALAASALAQGRGASIPPPVVSRTVEVQRGGKVTIPLGIHGARGEMLEFLIRTPPSHGRLSAVKNTAMNSALVTYTPAGGNASEDRFTYAVRGSEGVSAPGLVTIRIEDPVVAPARLSAPGEVDFPAGLVGERSTAELEIANEGGGFLEGEVAVTEPWSVEGLKFFKVAGGQRTTLRLVFTPHQPGIRTGEAVISGTQRKVILLRASADERLAVATPQLKLAAQPGSHTRMAVLKIVNRSAADTSVSIEAGPQLMTDRAVKVPARSEAAVPVFADAAAGSAFEETLKLSNGEWSSTVSVRAQAIGAILKFTGAEASIAGTVAQGEAVGSVTLENSGAEPVTARLDVEPPFDVRTRVVTAPANGRVEIPVNVRFTGPGKFQTTLKAVSDAATAQIPVRAEISEGITPASPPAPSSRETPTEEEAVKVKASPAQDEPQNPVEAREVPNALGRFARGTGTDTATIEWPASFGYAGIRIEERTLAINADGDDLQVGWIPIKNATMSREGETVRAGLRGLAPGILHTVRVLRGNGAEAEVLFTVDFWTAAKPPFFTASLLRWLLFAALLALLAAVWRARNPKMR